MTAYTLFHYTAASEVSSILEQRISGSSGGGDVQETGRVLSEYLHLLCPNKQPEANHTAYA